MGEQPEARLAARVGVPKATLSRHLAVIRMHGLQEARRTGRIVLYRLACLDMLRAYELPRGILVARPRAEGELARRLPAEGAK